MPDKQILIDENLGIYDEEAYYDTGDTYDNSYAPKALETIYLTSILKIFDSSLASDSILAKRFIFLIELSSSFEDIVLKIKATVSDTSFSTESILKNIKLTISDSGLSSDVLSILNKMLLSDSGISLENILNKVYLALLDYVSGNETVYFKNLLSILETTSSSDIVSIVVNFIIADILSSSDIVYSKRIYREVKVLRKIFKPEIRRLLKESYYAQQTNFYDSSTDVYDTSLSYDEEPEKIGESDVKPKISLQGKGIFAKILKEIKPKISFKSYKPHL